MPHIREELTMALHDTQEFYDDLGRGPDEHLALAATLGIDNVVLASGTLLLEIRRKIDARYTRQSFCRNKYIVRVKLEHRRRDNTHQNRHTDHFEEELGKRLKSRE